MSAIDGVVVYRDCISVLNDVMDSNLAETVANRVLMDRAYWVDRGVFYTLGAATYQDDPLVYPAMARAFNDVIQAREEYRKAIYISSVMAAKIHYGDDFDVAVGVLTPDKLALPSFHVFDQRANGQQGSIHIDEPYLRVKWPVEYSRPFSFTLPILMPQGGGGLTIWPDVSDVQMTKFFACGNVPSGFYIPYEVGSLYVHDGLTPHQIANPCKLGDGEYRITLQGHGVMTESGQVCVYF